MKKKYYSFVSFLIESLKKIKRREVKVVRKKMMLIIFLGSLEIFVGEVCWEEEL